MNNVLSITLFSLFASCNTIQGMKRRPEISPYLLQAVEEAMQYEDVDIWRDDVTSVIKKKVKFEAALAQVDAPKRIPPIRITLPKIVKPTSLDEKTYHCTLCNVWFKSDRSRKRHIATSQQHQEALAMLNIDLDIE